MSARHVRGVNAHGVDHPRQQQPESDRETHEGATEVDRRDVHDTPASNENADPHDRGQESLSDENDQNLDQPLVRLEDAEHVAISCSKTTATPSKAATFRVSVSANA